MSQFNIPTHPRKPKLLILAPVFDMPTVISYKAAKILFQTCLDHQVPALCLEGIHANPVAFEYIMLKYRPDAILYFGHGTDDSIVGEFLFAPLISQYNMDLLKGTGIIAMACSAAKELGKQAVQFGVTSFLGNVSPVFAGIPTTENNYMDDFIKIWLKEPFMILQGHTFQQAYNDTRQAWKDLFASYKKRKLKNIDFILNAKKNYDAHVLLGDGNATLANIMHERDRLEREMQRQIVTKREERQRAIELHSGNDPVLKMVNEVMFSYAVPIVTVASGAVAIGGAVAKGVEQLVKESKKKKRKRK